jgi:uncharacterized integral membrane protein
MFTNQNVVHIYFPHIRATCPADVILLGFIILIILVTSSITIRIARLRWAGHVKRMGEEALPRRIM